MALRANGTKLFNHRDSFCPLFQKCSAFSALLISYIYYRIIEDAELQGTHKDHQVQFLALCRTTPKITPSAWEHCPDTP